jgi:hypothetical protein
MNLLKNLFKSKTIEIENPDYDPQYFYMMGNKLRKVLYVYISLKFDEWYNLVNKPLNAGDIVVLDKYNMNNSSNTWDGGPRLVIKKDHRPFKLKIIKVSGSQSLSTEIVDRYLNDIFYTKFFNSDGSVAENALIYDFEKYCIKLTPPYLKTDNHYGFYLNCFYESLDEDVEVISYQSGLNINSFIPATSVLATKTLELWEMEYELYKSQIQLNELEDKFKKKKNDLSYLIQNAVEFYKTVT